ncbi:peptidoglycan-binding protein [Streptomyces albiaxialis]|uniref:Peptidoglycan-binding protein n=1 Tax=Streptomyces albiaxialis TaxID=329523 RepID=A0ABN2W0Q8_9ACTN
MSEDIDGAGLPAVPEEWDAPVEQAPPDGGRRRRPWRTPLVLLTAVAVAGAAGWAATGALGGDSGASTPDTSPAAGGTTEVARTTLTRTETVEGTLGYGKETTVRNTAGGGGDANAKGGGKADGNGIVTWLPAEGDTLKRGDTVYGVDGSKVPLLYGATPFYRTLKPGSEGDDVKTLEKNLAALGYTGFTVDDDYTSGTAEAVRDWQEDLGQEETGQAGPGDAVVADGARRVMGLKTSPGGPADGEMLTWTGTERVVTVALEAQFEDLVQDGTKATVRLPDGASTEAEVTDIGTAGGSSEADQGAGSGSSGGDEGGEGEDEESTLPVELKVASQKKLGRYQAAAVDVDLKAETREDVLAVPVNALTARAGGGYALEVRTRGGRTERRPVELGMFADGKVEVSGKGITEGLTVGVPE